MNHYLQYLLIVMALCAASGGKGRAQTDREAGAGQRAAARAVATDAAASTWAPREFPISFWCGPPSGFLTLERFREIKEAGFTHVQPPCGAVTTEENKKILTLCAQVGLKAFIADSRMPLQMSGVANATARLDAIINDYKNYPALEGYHLTDEPGAGAFNGLAEVVAYLREKDPKRRAFINLFPNYANAQQLGTPTYEDHVRRYLEQVKPFVLSYDHYHFLTSGDRPGFISNLSTVRKLSREFRLPFWNIVLCVQHGPYRSPSEGELRYEAMQTLAYGGKGLLWFTYWQPDDKSFDWSHAMINLDGTRDPHYDMVRRVNAEVSALGGQLLNADCTAAFHAGKMPPDAAARTFATPLDILDGDVTVGLFQKKKGDSLALVANADYKQATTARVMFFTRHGVPKRFDAMTQRWSPVAGAVAQPGGFLLSLPLSPGGAALLRW